MNIDELRAAFIPGNIIRSSYLVDLINLIPYTYSVLLTQTSTNAPVVTVSHNSLTSTVTSSYVSVGNYKLSVDGGFDTSKTHLSIPIGVSMYMSPNYVAITYDTDNNILIQTWSASADLSNGVLVNFPFELKIFN